jgi:drug/metabolite transporter (DMT)-like permease
MTPEQVTRLKGWMFAMIGGGIASLIMAYQYTIQPVGRGEPPPAFASYLFGVIGIVCLIVAAVIARKTNQSGVEAATTDLKSPQGNVVFRLMLIGLIALAGMIFIDFAAPAGDLRWLTVSIILLIIMGVCFIIAGRLARKIRRSTAAKKVTNE